MTGTPPIEPADADTLAVVAGLTPAHTADMLDAARHFGVIWSAVSPERNAGTPNWTVVVTPDAHPGRKATVGHAHVVAAMVRLAAGAALDSGALREFLNTAGPDRSTGLAGTLHDILAAAANTDGDVDEAVSDAMRHVDAFGADDVLQTAVLGAVVYT